MASAVTGVGGLFSFTGLGPLPVGTTYVIREVNPPNFVQMTNNPLPITVTSGGNVSGVLFGNAPVSIIIPGGKLLLTGKNLINLLNGTLGRQANFVSNLYHTLLGRAPTLAGVTYYLRLIMAGYTEAQVTKIFKSDFKLPATQSALRARTASLPKWRAR